MLRVTKNETTPVLNDWDLSVIPGESPEVGEHTATIPFLAGDLLSPAYWEGKIKVLYRHDLESFVWILLWVFVCYRDRKAAVPDRLREWQTANYNSCYGSRVSFLNQFEYFAVPEEWATEWPILTNLKTWLFTSSASRMLQQPEIDNANVLGNVTGLLRKAGEYDGLEYLRDTVL